MSSPKSHGEPFTEEELAAWHGMLQVHSRVLLALDRELLRKHNLPVREFDVLITLFNAPERRLRMSDLARNVMLSPSGLTRLVERLERSGLVERQNDRTDARSYHAVLTDAGLKRLDEARATHNAVIRELFTDRFRPEELRRLGAFWSNVLADEPDAG